MSRSFLLDSAEAGAFPMETFARLWQATIGDALPLPGFDPSEYVGRTWAARADEVSLNDMRMSSPLRTRTLPTPGEDVVRLYVVERGRWHLDDPYGRGPHTLSSGQFLLQHMRTTTHFETSSHLAARIVMVPSGPLRPLLGEHVLTGTTDRPELRLLLAHVDSVRETLADLSPAGVRAADATLLELTKALAAGRFDDQEPHLSAPLARAARNLADRWLAEADVSPARLARELHVSVRTLQRAFESEGESVGAYVRRRRLEEAWQVLTTGVSRLSVAELAAHWHFADSSHFSRAFKSKYGLTPTDVTRRSV